MDLEICEKVYADKTTYSIDFPYAECDDSGNVINYYKKAPIEVTDEEYEEIKKCSDTQCTKNDENPIATILRVIAIIVYITGFIASFFLGVDKYGDISAMVMVWWIVFFISGTFYLGFAEIIKLLNDIKNK